MEAKKILIISIGTGTGPDKQLGLAGAINHSISHSGADKVYLIATKQSKVSVLPLVLKGCRTNNEVKELEETDDIDSIYKELTPLFKSLKGGGNQLVVDYTSGTKAMTGALCVLASIFEADEMSYVSGQRQNGVVASGTEKLLNIRPFEIVADKKLKEAAGFFNLCQYEAAKAILIPLEQKIRLPEILNKVTLLKNVSHAYSEWENFKHNSALTYFVKITDRLFTANKAFLSELQKAEAKEPFFIADIINNAIRRGTIEKKYDDAVARLYRVIELIAQYLLKQYGVNDTGSVPSEKIPEKMKWLIRPNKSKIELGQRNAYLLLEAYGNNLGQKYTKDNDLKNLLNARNESILAHGTTPVNEGTYSKLRDIVVSYAKEVIPEMDKKIRGSAFVVWEE